MSGAFRMRDDALGERGKSAYRRARGAVTSRLRKRLNRPRAVNDVLARVPLHFEVMAHFSDPPTHLYQIRQWLYPLERLNERHPVFILTRNTRSFQILANETDLPVVNALRIGTVDSIVWNSDIKLCLYVNQTARNFQTLRYPEVMHTFLSHGESDKTIFIASNQLKAYDFTFAAGDAAVDRIKQNLINYDVDRSVRKIGRPPLDTPSGQASSRRSDRTTVLYAPTWEGDRPSASYGSVESHGRGIVERILASPDHRLIYRPHPRTGATLASAGRADRELREIVERAARSDPDAGHRVDVAPYFGPQMDEADLMITDISAVAADFLVTGKPLIVTTPVNPGAMVNREGMLSSAYDLPVSDLGGVVGFVDQCLSNDSKRTERRRWAEYHFGDLTPGAATNLFIEACSEVIETRDKLLAQRQG